MLRIINCKETKMPVEVKIYLGKKFLGWVSMEEFGFVGGCPIVFDILSEAQLKRVESSMCRIWVNKAGY